MSEKRWRCRWMIALALVMVLIPLAVSAAIKSSEEDAGTRGGSRLRRGDRIIIWPEAVTNGLVSQDATRRYQECTTLYNRTLQDYFVGWKTEPEWVSFLAARARGVLNTSDGPVEASRCCAPQLVSVCGVEIPPKPGVPPEYDTNLGQRTLAARRTPANPLDLEYYGATYDVRTLQSQTLLNNKTINYEVTYMCDVDGTWTKTREVGSCTPIDGACNAAYTTNPITTMPSPTKWQQLLCAKGSVLHDPSGSGLGPFVTGTGPWDWQCDGTPGRAAARCHASYSGCNSAIIPEAGFRTLPPTSKLCLSGNTVTNLSPTSGNGPWEWQCRKNDNGFVSNCRAAFDPTTDGICNPAFTDTPRATVPLPRTGLCLSGTTPVDAVADALCDARTCKWTCAGNLGGKDAACRAFRQQTPGVCGSLNGETPIAKPADSDPNLCSQGTPTSVTGTASGPRWSWSCVGAPDPVAVTCGAPNRNATLAGVCGTAQGQLFTDATPPNLTSAQLCAVGTPSEMVRAPAGSGGETWTWSCYGQNGGANSGKCWSQYFPGYNGPACGSANGRTFATAPSASSLCGDGNTMSGFTTSTNPNGWTWRCDDAKYPGAPVSCSARNTVQPVAGSCGAAYGAVFGDLSKPPTADKLCENGGAVIGFAWPTDDSTARILRWGCGGINGGNDTSATACSASFVPPLDGRCGVATGWTPNDISVIRNAAPSQLCQPSPQSTPSNIAANFNAAKPERSTISWTCSAASASGKSAQCSASYVPARQDAQCGVITATSISGRPADSTLCLIGTVDNWSAPSSGSGTVSWQCLGLYGGANKSCQQDGIEVVNPLGQCGKANGAYVPDKPNYNLCSGGSASKVTGTGPWNWTCGTNNVPCQAYICAACSGTKAGAFADRLVGSEVTKTSGSCTMAGQPIWSADATLQLSNDVPVTLRWTDSFNGAVSTSILPAAAPPQYCAPCYMRPTALIPGRTGALVRQTKGSCPDGITSSPSILPGTGLSP